MLAENTYAPPERCHAGYQRRAVPPLAHYRPLSRGETPPVRRGVGIIIYAPLRKSVSLGRRASNLLRQRWWRTFKVNPLEMPWAYVAETPRNGVDTMLRCVRRAPTLDGRACRVPRSPRCHRASARPSRDDCSEHPPLTPGGATAWVGLCDMCRTDVGTQP